MHTHRFWFEFYFRKPEQSDWEKRLQAFADARFKGLRQWKTVHTTLRAAGLRSLPAAEAAAAVARRGGGLFSFGAQPAVILDVREPEVFAGGHATGAANVPLYAPLVRRTSA